MPMRIEHYVQLMIGLRGLSSVAWVLPVVEGRQRLRTLLRQKYLRPTSLAVETSCCSLFLAVALRQRDGTGSIETLSLKT